MRTGMHSRQAAEHTLARFAVLAKAHGGPEYS
jgi:hypothetical protein